MVCCGPEGEGGRGSTMGRGGGSVEEAPGVERVVGRINGGRE